ncbi:MAG: O-antigen ligase family protein, partial [Gammaproteobacteria bacterium]
MQVWESRLQTTARWLTVALPVLLITGRAAADSALSLAAILFFIRCIGTGDWSWTRRTWVRVAFGLWLWMLLISNFAYKVGPSYTEALAWIRFVVFAAAAEAWLLDKIWMRRLVFTTGAALLFTAGDAILQYITGHDLFMHPRWSPTRLTGPFDHPEVGIYIARLFFPGVLGGYALAVAGRRTDLRQALVTAGALLLLTAIFLSGERAALLLTLFGVILIVLLWQGMRRALIVVAALIVGAIVLLELNLPIVQRQLDSTAATMANIRQSPYGPLWETGLMMGRDHPLTGVGMHNFRYVCQEPTKHFPGCNLHPHNMYIQWFAESGIPGLIGFAILVGT